MRKKFAENAMLDYLLKPPTAEKEDVDIPTNWDLKRLLKNDL